MGGNWRLAGTGGTAVAVRFSVTVRQVLEDGSEVPADGEVAAALAGTAEQFAGLAAWAADEARFLDLGEREEVIGEEGRELQRRLLEATFAIDAAREEGPPAPVISAAGIRHGTVEAGHERGVTSVFGPVRVSRMACRNRREPNLYPADARWILPGDPYSLGMRALAAFHLAAGGFGQAQEVIEARTGVTVGRAQLTGLAEDLAAWTGDFCEQRARDADTDLPDSDVIMMQGDGKGIAMRPEHRKGAGKADAGHPGIKKMAEIVAVADFTPAVREPEDIAAPPARRKAHPGPKARDKWVSASITESIEDMITAAFDEAGRRDPERARQRVFLAGGNKQQITAIEARARERGLKVPVLIDYIHVILSALFPCRDSHHRSASGPAVCAVRLPLPRCRLSLNHVRRISLQQRQANCDTGTPGHGECGQKRGRLPRQGRRRPPPRRPRHRRPVGRRPAAARPARPREGRRRHPRLRRRENLLRPPYPPPRPHRHGQGRHLPH
jgi:hypothetical protein